MRAVRPRLFLLVLPLLPVLAACPSDADGPGPGGNDGGNVGTGGAGGAPTAAGPCRVKCLEDLIGPCTPAAGTCVGEVNLDAGKSNVCFSNGVRYYTSIVGTTSTASYVNPDGSTCYVMETPTPATDFTKVTAYWKDASGKLVATQMTDTMAMTSSYVCADGTSYQLGRACWGMAAGGISMVMGACTPGICH